MSAKTKPTKRSIGKRAAKSVAVSVEALNAAATVQSSESPFTLVTTGPNPGVYARLRNGKQQYICGHLRPLGVSIDAEGRNAGIRVEIVDALRQRKRATIPVDKLMSPLKTYAYLSALGLSMPTLNAAGHGDAILQYLDVMGSTKKFVIVAGDGWHIIPNPDGVEPFAVYALGERIVHPKNASFSLCRRDGLAEPSASGNGVALDQLLRIVARDHLAVFTLCASVASMLLRPLRLGASLVFLVGKSSLGKSKLLRFAASLYGPATTLTWQSTKNGVNAAVRNYQDRVCPIDEVSQSTGAAFSELAYDLTNDSSKLRGTASGGLAATFRNVNVVLSGGEETPLSLIRKSGRDVKGGQYARLVSVPVEERYGVWTELGKFANGAEKSAAVEQLSHASAGAFASRFLPYMIEQVRSLPEDFAGEIGVLEAELSKGLDLEQDPVAHRVLKDFALYFYAGLMATEAKAVPWKNDNIAKSLAHVFKLWHREYMRERPAKQEDVMRQLRLYFQSQRGNQFPPLAEHGADHAGTLGGYEHTFRGETEACFLVLPAFFEQTVCKGVDMNLVVSALTDRGLLQRGPRSSPKVQVHMPGGDGVNRSFYVIRRAILAD
ncbi:MULTISPECIES: DUF927 domain-containing protein [unclassified Variovorax]|uniref:DUF927 domain-containing protein n=1 Tax=unclassified Variovorax TaxID=663243 RepID=UPI0032E7CE80